MRFILPAVILVLSLLLSGETGCHMDPLGHCGASGEQSESGCIMDPLGRCGVDRDKSTSPVRDEGCHWDPLGRCGANQ
jgi:hypothetical protein